MEREVLLPKLPVTIKTAAITANRAAKMTNDQGMNPVHIAAKPAPRGFGRYVAPHAFVAPMRGV